MVTWLTPLCQVKYDDVLIFAMNVISQRLLLCRKPNESERALSKRAGIEWRTYQRWKHMERRPPISISRAEEIAEHLDVSSSWLVGWETEWEAYLIPPDISDIG